MFTITSWVSVGGDSIISDASLSSVWSSLISVWSTSPPLVLTMFFRLIHYLHKSHNTVHLGGLFALKEWISCSLKHAAVPRVNNLYCFYVKNPPKQIALWYCASWIWCKLVEHFYKYDNVISGSVCVCMNLFLCVTSFFSAHWTSVNFVLRQRSRARIFC